MKKYLFLFVLVFLVLIPFTANAKPYSCTHSSSFNTSFQVLFQSNDGLYYGNECSSSPTKYLGFDFTNQPLTANTNYDFTLIYTIFIPAAAESLTTETTEVFLITDSSSLRLDNFTHVVLSENSDGNLKAITYRMDFNTTPPVTSDFWIRFTFGPEVGFCITGWNLESLDVSPMGETPTPTPTLPPNQDVIDNNNANTDKIINNNNQNTDKIIESNEKTQEVIKDQFQTCRDSYNLLNVPSTLQVNNMVSVPINLYSRTLYTIHYDSFSSSDSTSAFLVQIFGSNRLLKSIELNSSNLSVSFSLVDNANLIVIYSNRNDSTSLSTTTTFYNLMINKEPIVKPYEEYGKQVCTNRIDETNKQLEENNKTNQEINDNIKDDNVDEANNQASGFFDDFESDDFGLSDVITMPLKFIKGLASSKCYSLNLPLPFVDKNATLPCMTSIYEEFFSSFFSLYQVISTGIISYWICIDIFRMVQGFKNPESDVIEVMDL